MKFFDSRLLWSLKLLSMFGVCSCGSLLCCEIPQTIKVVIEYKDLPEIDLEASPQTEVVWLASNQKPRFGVLFEQAKFQDRFLSTFARRVTLSRYPTAIVQEIFIESHVDFRSSLISFKSDQEKSIVTPWLDRIRRLSEVASTGRPETRVILVDISCALKKGHTIYIFENGSVLTPTLVRREDANAWARGLFRSLGLSRRSFVFRE